MDVESFPNPGTDNISIQYLASETTFLYPLGMVKAITFGQIDFYSWVWKLWFESWSSSTYYGCQQQVRDSGTNYHDCSDKAAD